MALKVTFIILAIAVVCYAHFYEDWWEPSEAWEPEWPAPAQYPHAQKPSFEAPAYWPHKYLFPMEVEPTTRSPEIGPPDTAPDGADYTPPKAKYSQSIEGHKMTQNQDDDKPKPNTGASNQTSSSSGPNNMKQSKNTVVETEGISGVLSTNIKTN